MKQTRLKIAVLTTCLLGNSNLLLSYPEHHYKVIHTSQSSHLFSSHARSLVGITPLSNHVSIEFGPPNEQALSIYHHSLKFLISNYSIPKQLDQIQAIRSHDSYVGQITHPLNAQQAMNKLKHTHHPYLIFELKRKKTHHFYLVHSRGSRHFVVKSFFGNDGTHITKLLNGSQRPYPNISSFIHSTFI